MSNIRKRRKTAAPPASAASTEGTPSAPERADGAAAIHATAALPPAAGFRLVRYFLLASLSAFVLFAAALLYFEQRKNDFFKQVQQEQNGFFTKMQEDLIRRHDAAAGAYLLRLYEAGNVNLGRLFANAMWERDIAPIAARAQRIDAERCRAIAEVKDAGGRTVPSREKQACQAHIGKRIMALPEFPALDTRMSGAMKNNTVLKIKVYDLRGVTLYSSERRQIGEDASGNEGWKSAAAGKPASALTHRDRFGAFEGEVANRHLIASYLPIHAPRTESIVGVFEIYSDVTAFVEQIDSTSVEIRKGIAENHAQLERAAAANRKNVDANASVLHAAILGTLALLYLVLFLIVRNAQRIMDRQDGARRRAEQALARQKDLYAALSQTNKAIVHLSGREELFRTVCRIAVEHGRFRFAWIGLTDADGLHLEPAARYGEDAGYMNQLDTAGDGDGAPSRGLTERTLLSGTYVVSNDFLHDPAMAPWREAGRRAGVRASAKFPIRQGGAVVGAISLYASETGFFTEALIATLEEMALDVSFALDNYQHEAQRRQALEATQASETRFRSLFENMLNGFAYCRMEYDDGNRPVDFVYLDVNRAFERLTGLRNVVGRTVTEVIPGIREANPELFEIYGRVAASGNPEAFEIELKPLGQWFSVSVYGPERGHFVAVFDVITERKQSEQALRAAEEQFRGLVEQSIAGTYIIQDGKLAYANPRCAEILGHGPAEELIGRDPLLLIAEADRGKVAEHLRRLLDGEAQSVELDFGVLRLDGLAIQVSVNGARATHGGRPAVIGLMQDISEKRRAEEEIRRYIEQLKTAFMSTVEVATTLSEMRDPYTAGHERRVARIAVAIGAELGLDARRQEGLRVAGFLHDIGKITIPAEILSKPGKLSPIEFQLIQGHARAGYDVLSGVAFPWPVAEVALQHHERMDGSGYPQGLKGDAILLEARILAVADVVEAMASYRPYRPALGIDVALAEIERGRGSAYDPAVADACLALFREKGYAIPA